MNASVAVPAVRQGRVPDIRHSLPCDAAFAGAMGGRAFPRRRVRARTPCGIFVLVLMIGANAGNSRGQSITDPDSLVSLNEGIYYYLSRDYDAAIQRFSAILERQPGDQTALLFRGLSNGRKALSERFRKRTLRDEVATIETVLKIRKDGQELDRIKAAVESPKGLAESGGEGEQRVANEAAKRLKDTEDAIAKFKGRPRADIDRELNAKQQELYQKAAKEREYYLAMIADLKQVLGSADDPKAVVRLSEVLATANIARIDDLRSQAIDERILVPATGETVPSLRGTAKRLLEDAAAALQSLLEVPTEQLNADDLARTRFFFGVIRYRQGIPPTKRGEQPKLTATDLRMFQDAQRYLSELADDQKTPLRWRSYASLYLGLVLPWIASEENVPEERRERLLQEARRHLADALRLDSQYLAEQKEADKGSDVAKLVLQQRELIDAVKTEQKLRNDISLSAFFGTRYDTNVVLLGERADLPRDISRQRDFGLASGAAVDYTRDLTERLAIGVQIRTAQLWNAGVEQFDQQTYGTSLAWQYEFLRKEGSMGPWFFTLQYDFDYTMLGKKEFLQNHAVRPGLKFDWANSRATSEIYFNYQRRDYSEPLFDRRFNRDGNYFTIGVLQEFKTVDMAQVYKEWGIEPWGLASDAGLDQEDPDYPKRYLKPYIGVRHSWDSTAGDEFDRSANALQAGVEVPLPWGIAFDAGAVLERENYSHGSLVDFHRRERRDLVQEYAFALSRTFVVREGMRTNRYSPAIDRMLMTVRAHATWTNDDSNVLDRPGQAVFSYDRAVYGLSVAFTLN